MCPQAPLSAWSARTEAPCGRPSSDWSWRTSGSSACGTSFRRPTAWRTGPSTFWPAATFEPWKNALGRLRADLIPKEDQRLWAGALDPTCPTSGHEGPWRVFPFIRSATVHRDKLWRDAVRVWTPLELVFHWRGKRRRDYLKIVFVHTNVLWLLYVPFWTYVFYLRVLLGDPRKGRLKGWRFFFFFFFFVHRVFLIRVVHQRRPCCLSRSLARSLSSSPLTCSASQTPRSPSPVTVSPLQWRYINTEVDLYRISQSFRPQMDFCLVPNKKKKKKKCVSIILLTGSWMNVVLVPSWLTLKLSKDFLHN